MFSSLVASGESYARLNPACWSQPWWRTPFSFLKFSKAVCEHLAVYLNSVGAGQSVYSLLSSPPHPPRYLTCFSLELQCYSKIHFTAIAAPGWRTGIGMKIVALVLLCCWWALCWPWGNAGAETVVSKREGVLEQISGSGARVVGGKSEMPS